MYTSLKAHKMFTGTDTKLKMRITLSEKRKKTTRTHKHKSFSPKLKKNRSVSEFSYSGCNNGEDILHFCKTGP